MPRQAKPHRILNCKLQLDVWNEMDAYCKETGINKTFLVERAVREYLEKQKRQQDILKRHNIT